MNELQHIQATLKSAARRRRTARALRGLWMGLFIGAGAALLLSIAFKVFPLPEFVLYVAAAAPITGIAVGALSGALRPVSLSNTARWLDERENLQQRLSTAVENVGVFENAADPGHSWRELLLTDAVKCVDRLDLKAAIQFHVSHVGKAAGLLLLLTAVLGFIPEHRSPAQRQAKRDIENIRETARRLAEVTRRELEQRPPRLESARAALLEATDTAERISARPPTREEALRELENAAERLRQVADAFSKTPGAKQLQRVGRSGANSFRSSSDLQKQMAALQEQLGGGSATPEQVGQLQQKLGAAAQAAAVMSRTNASASDMRSSLGQGLSDLAAEANELGIDLPRLEEAMQALAAGDSSMFLKNLDSSLLDLEKVSQLAQSLKALQQDAAALGRDLAEQLAKGQPQAAKETLDQLASRLRQGKLTPEERAKLLEEVAKAVGPAGNYGELSKHLQAAADRIKQGQQTGAANALENASKELEDLMQQFADAESALAAMDALKDAAFAIGTGQLWRPGPRGNRPGPNTGLGVGTWDDAQRMWDGSVGEMPDNSGFQRSDEDSRSGLSEAEQGPDLTPTQVRGQFSPGSQMPSVPLRGVGIRGQSKVAYEEAATAAQIEAESALGQDKVPRAYRDAVKNYFDELKD